ncbi:hypothetical protein Q1695_001605 [Nippostrongylus brasiliensis]|nr:hypothetical protein Q1695_001605 [Nippostrongylus brasiliensis]
MRPLLLGVTIISVLGQLNASKDLSNGYGTEIEWVKWEQAIGVAKDLNKPIFFLIHKTWCGACKGLKREFSTSSKMPDLIKLSKKFVMVNVEDDDEPEDDKYAPDGGYIPRILFLDTDAELLKTNNEEKYKNNKYFYPLIPQIISGMERALDEFAARNEDKEAKQTKSKKDEANEEKEKEKENTKSKKEDKKEKETEKDEKKKEEKKAKKEKSDDKKTDEKKAKSDDKKSEEKKAKSDDKKTEEKKAKTKKSDDKKSEEKKTNTEEKKKKESGKKNDKKVKKEEL